MLHGCDRSRERVLLLPSLLHPAEILLADSLGQVVAQHHHFDFEIAQVGGRAVVGEVGGVRSRRWWVTGNQELASFDGGVGVDFAAAISLSSQGRKWYAAP